MAHAQTRGQSLAQMAIAWRWKMRELPLFLLGKHKKQLIENAEAIKQLSFQGRIAAYWIDIKQMSIMSKQYNWGILGREA